MSPSGNFLIDHVSDTALWVAFYRGMETKRSDALFHDSWAEILAGEKGKRIALGLPSKNFTHWGLVVRTKAIDRFILEILTSQKVDMVLNLGAGLDTRPYRLLLPEKLKWVEVDLPDILAYKEILLKEAKPVCRVERISCDLLNKDDRNVLFTRLNEEAQKILIVSEGFLTYLTLDQGNSLLECFNKQSSFRYWILDYLSGKSVKAFNKGLVKYIALNVQAQFSVENWIDYFIQRSWKPIDVVPTLDEAMRLRRAMPLTWLLNLLGVFFPSRLKKINDEIRQNSGIVVLERN
jgi:methyltransferase (TIGR00027 family)